MQPKGDNAHKDFCPDMHKHITLCGMRAMSTAHPLARSLFDCINVPEEAMCLESGFGPERALVCANFSKMTSKMFLKGQNHQALRHSPPFTLTKAMGFNCFSYSRLTCQKRPHPDLGASLICPFAVLIIRAQLLCTSRLGQKAAVTSCL